MPMLVKNFDKDSDSNGDSIPVVNIMILMKLESTKIKSNVAFMTNVSNTNYAQRNQSEARIRRVLIGFCRNSPETIGLSSISFARRNIKAVILEIDT